MADAKAGSASAPEAVAYRVLDLVLRAEGRGPADETGASKLSRNLILDAYSDSLDAVRGQRATRSSRRADAPTPEAVTAPAPAAETAEPASSDAIRSRRSRSASKAKPPWMW